eukprot:m51a1_g302 Transport protein particle (TRAPP) component Trs130B (1283) ;mRNA; f:376509-381581
MGDRHCVSYVDSSGGTLWAALWPLLCPRLPLCWRPAGCRPAAPPLPLPLDFVPPGPGAAGWRCWHRLPLLHLFLVDGRDAEQSAAAQRAARDWVEGLGATPTGGQWLVVVATQGSPVRQLFQGSAVARLRRALGCRDRHALVALRWDGGGEELWSGFLARASEAAAAGFEDLARLLRDQAALHAVRGDALGYCGAQEALAAALERAGLPRAALAQLDELEAALGERADSEGQWRWAAGERGPESCAASLIDAPPERCRELIAEGRLSRLDALQFLFSRQAALCFALRSPASVASRAASIVRRTHAELCQTSPAPAPLFAAAWTLTAAPSVVSACLAHAAAASAPSAAPDADDALSAHSLPAPRSRWRSPAGPKSAADAPLRSPAPRPRGDEEAVAAADVAMRCELGGLLCLGRAQLEAMGVALGLYNPRMQSLATALPDAHAAVLAEMRRAIPEGPAARAGGASGPPAPPQRAAAERGGQDERKPADREPLLLLLAGVGGEAVAAALASEEAFDRQYVALTLQARQLYERSGRVRLTARLTRDLALLHFTRGRWLDAAGCLEAVAQQLEADQWAEMAGRFRGMLALCQRHLERWPHYAESCARLLSPSLPLSALEGVYYAQQLFDAVPSLLGSRHVVPMGRALRATPGALASAYAVGDAVEMRCTVESSLAVPVQVQSVSLRLVRSTGAADDSVTLSPGASEHTLRATAATPGDFRVDGRLVLEKAGLALAVELLPPGPGAAIAVRPSAQTAELVALLPPWLPVGSDSATEAALVVEAREDGVAEGAVTIASPTGLDVAGGRRCVLLEARDAAGRPRLAREQRMSAATLGMLPLARGETCTLRLLIAPQASPAVHQVSVGLSYAASSGQRLSLRKDLSIAFGLPLQLRHWVAPLGEASAAVQIRATNAALAPLTIADYSLTAGAPLCPAQQSVRACELRVRYDYPSAERAASAVFSALLPLHLHSHDYEALLTAAPEAVVVGCAYRMSFTLARTHGEGEDRVLLELRFDRALWAVAGFVRQTAMLVGCRPSAFAVALVPLAVGRLPLPEVVLPLAAPARVGHAGWSSVPSFPDSDGLVCSLVAVASGGPASPAVGSTTAARALSSRGPRTDEEGGESTAEAVLCWVDRSVGQPATQYLVDNVRRQRPRTLVREMASRAQLSAWLDRQAGSAVAPKLRVVASALGAADSGDGAALVVGVVSLLRLRAEFAETPVAVLVRTTAGLEGLSLLPGVLVTTAPGEALRFASARKVAAATMACSACKQPVLCYACGICGLHLDLEQLL